MVERERGTGEEGETLDALRELSHQEAVAALATAIHCVGPLARDRLTPASAAEASPSGTLTTFAHLRAYLDGILTVTEAEIAEGEQRSAAPRE